MDNNMHTIYRQLLLFVFTALLCTSLAYAGETVAPGNGFPDSYPASFQAKGVVGQASSRSISVSGSRYSLSISAQVHSLSGNHASVLDLRRGTEIGFSFERNANNRRTITEIWILPQGTIKPS
jgi:hypothetical protein